MTPSFAAKMQPALWRGIEGSSFNDSASEASTWSACRVCVPCHETSGVFHPSPIRCVTNAGADIWLTPVSRQITNRSFSKAGRWIGIARRLPLRTSSATADRNTSDTPRPAFTASLTASDLPICSKRVVRRNDENDRFAAPSLPQKTRAAVPPFHDRDIQFGIVKLLRDYRGAVYHKLEQFGIIF